jgi:hypothetical protein
MPASTRRRWLRLVGSLGLASVAGCLDTAEIGNGGPTGVTSTEEATPPPEVRTWANRATPSAPVRGEGDSTTARKSVTDEPGFRDDFEYLESIESVRYVSATSGGQPVRTETVSFERWARIQSATLGARRAARVTNDRLGTDGIDWMVGSPPPDADADARVITLTIVKTLDREGNIVEWPPVTLSQLVDTTPRSVDATYTLEDNSFSRTIPVYAQYEVLRES